VPVHRKVRFHDLRHTAASLYLGAGVRPARSGARPGEWLCSAGPSSIA
jgi:integrase